MSENNFPILTDAMAEQIIQAEQSIQDPPKITTTEKYLIALVDIKKILSTEDGVYHFKTSRFVYDNHLTNIFAQALIELGILKKERSGSRKLTKWNLDRDPDIETAMRVRHWCSMQASGRPPLMEKSFPVGAFIQRPRKYGRKPPQNGSNGIARPGAITKDSILTEVEQSFFKKLCPQCAETMIQFIEMIKQKPS